MNHEISKAIWGNPTLFHWAKSTEKNWEKMNSDTINWEKLFPPGKIYWKKISRKDKYWHNQLKKAFVIDLLSSIWFGGIETFWAQKIITKFTNCVKIYGYSHYIFCLQEEAIHFGLKVLINFGLDVSWHFGTKN